ncbi:two-component system response regulator [Thermoplasmatales archaeon ex4572_165]|nr:MAG: two-component system response regulator [Thermoplasmatales archaeon ex4572_165]
MAKVMVVDDEPDLRDMINLMMQKEGYETETAENGEDFLKKIDDFQPDIVTLDVMMPGLTTKEILDKIKEKKSDPKIILCTVVRFSDNEKKRLFDMGNVIDYITKPFDFDIVIKTVKEHVK